MGSPILQRYPDGQAIAGGGRSPLRLATSEFMYFPSGGTDPEQGDADWQTNANKQADAYELFTPRGIEYKNVLTGMRARRTVNMPPLTMLGYARASGYPGGVESPGFAPAADANHPVDVYNYDTEAAKTPYTSEAYVTGGGAYIMRVWDYRWAVVFVPSYYVAMLADMAYDGTLMDVMGDYPTGTANHKQGDPTLSKPWNPILKTNATWFTGPEWMNMTTNIAGHVKTSIGRDKIIGANGIGSGSDYWASSRTLMRILQLAMVEDMIRASTNSETTWPTVTEAKDVVNMLVDGEIWGHQLFCNVKLWPTTPSSTDAARILRSKQWLTLGTALYLLGTDGLHFFGFRHDKPAVTAYPYAQIQTATIGTASGVTDSMKGRHRQFVESYYGNADIWWKRINLRAPTQFGRDPAWTAATTTTNHLHVEQLLVATKTNMWSRTFTNGVVVVNMHTADQTYVLPGTGADTYQDIDGTNYAGASTVTIVGTTNLTASTTGERNAMILTKQ